MAANDGWNLALVVFAGAWMVASWRRHRRTDPGECWLAFATVAAGGAKLWLARAQPLCAVPAAPWDDRLFLQLADHLRAGEWLGPYNRLTLAKGPFYPIFMAAASTLKLPLITAQNLAYIAAAGLFVRALRPLRLPLWIRVSLTVFLLLCPVLSDSGAFVRAWRQSLWPSLVLLSFAGIVGLALRAEASRRAQAAWAILAGGAIGAMWLTREEGIWTLPMLALPLLVAGWRACGAAGRGRRILWLLVPAAVAGLEIGLAAFQNYRAYQFWGIVEFHDDAFVSAYSALCRVKPLAPERRIPVTRAARERIYAVSPAFASLRHEIEDGIGAAFMKVTQDNTGIPASEHEIGGGWMMWTLREAVANTGQAGSARDARAFYRRLAKEVDAACDDGRLDALPPRHSMMPSWRNGYLPSFWAGAKISLQQILAYPLTVDPVPSLGSPEDLAWAQRITHERVAPGDPAAVAALRRPWRLALLRDCVAVYGRAMPWLFGIAAGAWIGLLLRAAYRRDCRWLTVIGTSLALGIAGNIAVVALINAMSWPSINLGYLGASLPLAVCFVGAILTECWLLRPRADSRSGR